VSACKLPLAGPTRLVVKRGRLDIIQGLSRTLAWPWGAYFGFLLSGWATVRHCARI